ncbi:hypothetical protein Dda_2269 [Drechslerella dactyloides]|uniref:Uncharacterized protein n=1 Tax=Drechslerella dactyloides TaxID=74499 RepID=A0AAD6J5K5_DREDA|nr:hypothetical protein Dda_2269 [Drechslerella dactyloides]
MVCRIDDPLKTVEERETRARRACLQLFTPEMRGTIREEKLIEIHNDHSFVRGWPRRWDSDGTVERYFHHYIASLLQNIPTHNTWSERYRLLRSVGVSGIKTRELERLRREWATAFHLDPDDDSLYLRHLPFEEQLLDIVAGIADEQEEPPKACKSTKVFWPDVNWDPERTMPRYPLSLGWDSQSVMQILFPTVMEFREWLQQQPSHLPGVEADTFDTPEAADSACQQRAPSVAVSMYQGYSLRGGDIVEPLLSDPSPKPASYFGGSPLDALTLAALKATSYAHPNAPFSKLVGVLVSFTIVPRVEGVCQLQEKASEEHIPEDAQAHIPESDANAGKMIEGGKRRSAELEDVDSEESPQGDSKRTGPQGSSRDNECIDNMDSLRQAAVWGIRYIELECWPGKMDRDVRNSLSVTLSECVTQRRNRWKIEIEN